MMLYQHTTVALKKFLFYIEKTYTVDILEMNHFHKMMDILGITFYQSIQILFWLIDIISSLVHHSKFNPIYFNTW